MNNMDNKNFLLKHNKTFLKILAIAIVLAVLSVLLGICTLVMTAIPCDFKLVKILVTDYLILFVNTWPIFCFMTIVYFFTNTIWISFLCTGIVVFVIAEVNRFKMAFRDDPFVFSDILLIGEARDMVSKYTLYLDKVSLCAVMFIAMTTILSFFLFKFKLKNKIIRLLGVIAFCFITFFSCISCYIENDTIYINTWHMEFGNQWKIGNQYMSRGVIYSFIRSISDAVIWSPEGYNERDTKKNIQEYKNVEMEEESKVHIISIMLEAYNDFSKFEGIEFIENPYENFHVIQKQGYSGELFTDIFAAGTIQTERSFLTGYRNTNLYDKDTESYVRYFKQQGYYTEAMHPAYGWFYDRKNVNEYLGFDNFEYRENKYDYINEESLQEDTYHGIISDYDFFDYIIEGYERALEAKKKYFNFSVTYQNHGPYSNGKLSETEYLRNQEQYTTDEYNIFNNYLAGISRTDRALGKLKDYIDMQEEPIVLILFGDHNPWLGENNSVYEMLGIDLNLDTPEGAKNYYGTPYVFYANDIAKKQLKREFVGQGSTVSPMFLMNEYFEYIGIGGSAYLNYLQTVKEKIEVINSVYVMCEDKYWLQKEFEDNEILREQGWIEYYVKSKKIRE